MTKAGINQVGRTCPYCRFPLENGQAVRGCPACEAVHHSDCWAEGGGCAIVGCASRASEAATAVQSAVDAKTVPAAVPPPTAPQSPVPQPPVPPPIPPQPMAPQSAQPLPPLPAKPVSQQLPAPPAGYVYAPAPVAGKESGSRALLYGLLAGVLIAAVGIGGYILANPEAPVSVTTQAPSPAPAETPAATPDVPSQESLAQDLSDVAQFSEKGRSAVGSGDYQTAIANREEVISRLDGITGADGDLEQARSTLRQAMDYSLQSDRCYSSGGSSSSCSGTDSQATEYKRQFVSLWNPIANRYGLPTYTESTI